MCMIFNKNHKPAYVRLCYKTGQAGQHYPLRSYRFSCISRERIERAIAEMEGRNQ